MFEKRKRWTGWTLAMALMLSLAPQSAMAAEMKPPVVQEETVASSSASGETAETGAETGTSSGQEDGTGSSGEEAVHPGADASTNGAGENTQSGIDSSANITDETSQPGTDSSEDSTKENVQPGTNASGNVGENTESLTEAGTDESSSEADDSTSSSEGSYPAVVLEAVADDGTSIKIDAPEGAFPEGIHVTVKAVKPDQILGALRTAADDPELDAEDVAAYDFDFWLDDETHQIEPKKEISVQIVLPELESGDTVSAWHLDSESDETAESETVTAESDSGTATITSDVFSIHAIVVKRVPAGGVTIDYDTNSDIHSVTEDGSKIILFCMNDGLHWPHSTSVTPNVPNYTETNIEDFCKANKVSDSDALAQKVKNVLYAGYPYNGYGLYQVVGQAVSLTEGEFNQLLDPPAYLRTDFPDSIGNNTFTYADRNDASKMALLTKFVQESMALYPNGSTSSGVSYSQLTTLPFWRAAYCMVTYTESPIDAYSTLYISGSYVTESQAYKSTSNAIWTLMFNNGVPDNKEVAQDALTTKLLGAADKNTILDQAPSSGSLSVTGDTTFRYSSEDGKWHTDPLKLSAPAGYLTPFTLSLPDGVSEESGRTQVTAGEEFSLVSASPASSSTISLSAKVPWMDGDLRVYEPEGNAVASDGKGFQNMVGAVIKTNEISVSAILTRTDEYRDLTFTKKWEDHNNQDGIRPTTADYVSKLHLISGSTEVNDVKPTVTDNGDNTWTIVYSNLPKYKDGSENLYSVKEDSINGYTADAETVKAGGTLTNTHKVPSSTPPTKETNPTNTQNVQASTTPTSETNPANTQNVTATTTPASETGTTESSIKTSDSAGTAANGSNTSSSGAAKTGDNSALELYGLLSALSMAALLILLGMKHRRNKV